MAHKVVDTTYYEALNVPVTASDLEIKKAYRRLAIIHHPDKNPGDATAHEKFQAIGEAYQVLSNPDLRRQYDRYGKDKAVPDKGFEDPAEFFGMIFGGDAFKDLIGEISLMKDLAKTMDITMKDEEEESPAAVKHEAASATGTTSTSSTAPEAAPEKVTYTAPPPPGISVESPAESQSAPPPKDIPYRPSPSNSGTSTPRPGRVPGRQAIMDKSDDEARMDEQNMTEEEKELKRKQKKTGLSKEQREQLAAYELERKKIREERVDMLAKKLLDRISIWTEGDKKADVTKAFQDKIQLEVENLKMESFGLEILHAVGSTYVSKAGSFLKSQKLFGFGGFFSKLKDKGTLAKDTWNTISSAIDAQMTMEEMAKAEERGGEDWTDEKKAEYERRVTGKILGAAWRGSKFEIQSVLRDVCDKILLDKSVPLSKREERAQAIIISGTIYQHAKRNPEEEGDYMAFEQLMAEAAAKKEKGKDKEEKKKAKPPFSSAQEHVSHGHGHGNGHGSALP